MKQQSIVFKRKSDLFWIGSILLICLLTWLIPMRNKGMTVQISVENRVLAEYSLETDRMDFTVSGADGFVFRIADRKCEIIKAPCRNQICCHSRPIGSAGQQIICLPEKLIVCVCSEKEAPDAVI